MFFDIFSSSQIWHNKNQRVIRIGIPYRGTANKLIAPFVIHRGTLLLFKSFNVSSVKLCILPPFTLEIVIQITTPKKHSIVHVLVIV
ncbi:MAG TPA: hypothetical protein DDY57_00695 [Franconibacter pulveris]|nr:hypothetical protein [Franconibacter pulveris]